LSEELWSKKEKTITQVVLPAESQGRTEIVRESMQSIRKMGIPKQQTTLIESK